MLREAAKSADEAQRDKLLSTAKLHEKSAEGFSGTFAQGLNETVQAPMPETVDDCLPDLKQLR